MSSAAAGLELVVGTRGSALAVAQTELVCDALRAAHPGLSLRVERITTTGDIRADVPLSELGRGIFVTEIEAALRAGRIDVAVHSAKDLPSTMPADLVLAAIVERADPRDVLVSRAGSLKELPSGARVGTSSPRRACQLRAMRPDIQTLDVRGNVDTRLRKLAAGEFDALVLAAAGLIRLGRIAEATEWLEPEVMVPSVGQGALAIEAREGDARVVALLAALDHAPTRAAVIAERAFLAELGAGCRAAAGAYAVASEDALEITAMIGAPDGRHLRTTRRALVRGGGAAVVGSNVARVLLRAGAAEFLAAGGALGGKRVAVTRPAGQSDELVAFLRARGAVPIACPTIAIQPAPDTAPIDAEHRDPSRLSWIAFTSANAVDAVADRLAALGTTLPAHVRLAAVGGSTAWKLSERIRDADFIPVRARASSLASELPVAAGDVVLCPRGDLALEALPAGLRARGVEARDVVVYRTVAGAGAQQLAQLVRAGDVDAIVFTSPSSVRLAKGIGDAVRDARPAPVLVCIGGTTARAAQDVGLPPAGASSTQSVGGIVEALERAFVARPALQPA